MSDTHHMIRKNGRWHYNRRLKKSLVGLVIDERITKDHLIRYSLNTSNHKAAVRYRNCEDVKWDAIFQAAEEGRPLPLTKNQAIKLVQEYVARTDREWQQKLERDGPEDEQQRLDMKIEAGTSEQVLTDLDDPRSDVHISRSVDKLLKHGHFELTGHSVPYSVLGELVRRGLLELFRRQQARLGDDHSVEFIDQLFSPKAQIRATFGDVCDQYMDLYRQDAKSGKTGEQQIDQTESRVNAVRELIGSDLPVNAINYDTCLEFRQKITGLPKSWAAYRGQSFHEVLANVEADGKETIGHYTQSEYLRHLTRILDLAHKKDLITAVYSSTLTPIAVKVPNAKKRDPFTNQQIKAIFTSGFYKECAASGIRPYEHAKDTWQFWLPLMCLLMGMRPKEACQMHLADVCQSDEKILYVDIVATTDEDDEKDGAVNVKTLKTEASRRKIPVHPELIKIGFRDYVEGLRSQGETMLLPDLSPNKYGNYAVYPLKRFRDKFLPDVIKLTKKQTFYSFRHSFRDALRRMEAPPDILKALGAWSQGSVVSDDYGGDLEQGHLFKYVERIKYPGLKLSHLYTKGS